MKRGLPNIFALNVPKSINHHQHSTAPTVKHHLAEVFLMAGKWGFGHSGENAEQETKKTWL